MSKPESPIARPSGWISHLSRRAVAIRNRWRWFKPTLRQAMVRIGAARGAGEKLEELRYLARRTRALLLRRAALASVRQSTAVSVQLSDYINAPAQVPECRSLGGGMLAISLADSSCEARDVLIRDGFGVTHTARRIQTIERRFEGAAVSPAPAHASGSDSQIGAVQIIVQAPSELFEHTTTEVEVQVRDYPDLPVFDGIKLQNASRVGTATISLQNSLILFSGVIEGSFANELKLGLFVDGELSASTELRPPGRRLTGAMRLDPRHLDGAIHYLALRDLSNMAVIASIYEFLPMHVTPWEALQTYARAPLDGTLSPAARHHFRSYRLWLDRIAEHPGNIPPIGRLYGELLHGFRKRREYPVLDFPRHEHPVASVIVPVHNKFEVTYLCLCSLLFAYNETPFEVIVVDDGSSDETLEIARFANGIRVLRHETARGYVESCNDGAAHANGEFVVFLNNDTEATARWLDELILIYRSFDNVGLLGSKLVYPDGRLQEAGGIIWASGNPWNVGRGGNAHDPRYNYLRQADYVSGAAMMLPRDVWVKVGGFDAEFSPGYFEDTDLAMKVREAGHLVVYVPTSTIVHFEGKSAGTDVASGMKRFQEINRPKFKRKWGSAVAGHGADAIQPDREKDRGAALRVLFLDHQFPNVDGDAGSYAAFQEIRLFQSLGAKVTFLPRNLAWMDRHTVALQRIGVECLYAPFVTNHAEYIRTHAREYDVVFVCRYQVAEQIIPLVRSSSPSTKIIFNLADLHFLRELREAEAGTHGYTRRRADETRRAELAVVQSCDLTFSYTDVELAVLKDHLKQPAALARMPWIAEPRRLSRSFAETGDVLFLGGFGHPPNAQAVRFFAREVMPGLRERLAGIHFDVVGKGAEDALAGLTSESLRVMGYVADLDEVMAKTRVFVAPLQTGAGLKGKVIEAISRGVPCVLSSIAAEGTDLTDGVNCLIADTVEQWTECVWKLYTDEALWTQIGDNALKFAAARYAFGPGVEAFEKALKAIGISGRREGALVYSHTRPLRYGV
ncbi:MAG TPA: glycosyltransferase [Rhizomicrobium sp.]